MKLFAVLHEAISEPEGGASSGRIAFLGSTFIVLLVWAAVALTMVGAMVSQHLDLTQFKFPALPVEVLALVLGSGALKVTQRIKSETTAPPDPAVPSVPVAAK